MLGGDTKGTFTFVLKTFLTVAVLLMGLPAYMYLLGAMPVAHGFLGVYGASAAFVVCLIALIVLLWKHDRRFLVIGTAAFILGTGLMAASCYDATRGTIEQDPDEVLPDDDLDFTIVYEDYLPFTSENIPRLDEEATLRLTEEDDLPVTDCAAALLPFTSGVVSAVYPDTIAVQGVLDEEGQREFDELDAALLERDLTEGEAERYGELLRWMGGDCPGAAFRYTNSPYGFGNLVDGVTDVFIGTDPSDEQLAYAAQHGVELESTPLALEAFVFIVNEDNPVESLTQQQVRDIYAGKIANWSEVGGADEEIVAFQRNEGSGSQSRMAGFMGDVPLMDPPESWRIVSMGGLVRAVAGYDNRPNGLGYSFRYYATQMVEGADVKLLAIDGVEPTVEHIADGSYPLTGAFKAWTCKGEANPLVADLVDWMRGPQGQLLVERAGYTPLP